MNNNSTNTGFLPEGYEVPNSSGNYMKFLDGANRFRIMSSPVIGNEVWRTEKDGSRKPYRYHMGEKITIESSEDYENTKHFWAMAVYNYDNESIQILEITQKGIQKALRALAEDSDWGSPVGTNGYDIVVTRSGQKLETEYQVQPKPAKKLTDGIEQAYKDMHINLEALFSGDDPFKEPEIDLDEVDKALSE